MSPLVISFICNIAFLVTFSSSQLTFAMAYRLNFIS